MSFGFPMLLSYRHRQALHLCSAYCRRLTTLIRAIAVGDVVALRPKRDCDKSSLRLTAPLAPGDKIQSHRGFINHDDIIGRLPREGVSTNKGMFGKEPPGSVRAPVPPLESWSTSPEGIDCVLGHEFTVHRPTLTEYIELTPRRVTPIYPADANLIVSLLDIHVTPPSLSSGDGTPLEILEGGTGHGALTLHLARAVHAANAARPPLPPLQNPPPDSKKRISPTTGVVPEGVRSRLEGAKAQDTSLEEEQHRVFEQWRSTRRAIIHTLDIDPYNSRHAERIVRGFQRGMYAGNVDFYTGDVSEWITGQLQRRAEAVTSPATGHAFLSYIFLDIPGVHKHLHRMQDALHVDGLLVVFTPSITQIAACVQTIREKKLPFAMDQVVELGLATTGLGSGRQWDVRVVNAPAETRKSRRTKWWSPDGRVALRSGSGGGNASQSVPLGQDDTQDGVELRSLVKGNSPEQEPSANDNFTNEDLTTTEEKNELRIVCRPKVGEKLARLAGGGFVAVWRRMRDMRSAHGGSEATLFPTGDKCVGESGVR